MTSRTRTLAIAAVFVLIALALLPFVAEKFTVQFATRILIMAIFAMSLNLLVGHTGLVSLGHAAFFGIAGYYLALASPQYQAAYFWTSLPLAMLAAGALALVIGALVLRTSGIYFIMATLAFAQMLYFLFHDTAIAGGSDGIYIYVRPDASILGWRPFDLEKFGDFYFVALTLFVAAFGFIFCPKTRTQPAVGRCNPSSKRTSVVLPAPFGPSRPSTVPGSMRNDTSLSAI